VFWEQSNKKRCISAAFLSNIELFRMVEAFYLGEAQSAFSRSEAP